MWDWWCLTHLTPSSAADPTHNSDRNIFLWVRQGHETFNVDQPYFGHIGRRVAYELICCKMWIMILLSEGHKYDCLAVLTPLIIWICTVTTQLIRTFMGSNRQISVSIANLRACAASLQMKHESLTTFFFCLFIWSVLKLYSPSSLVLGLFAASSASSPSYSLEVDRL